MHPDLKGFYSVLKGIIQKHLKVKLFNLKICLFRLRPTVRIHINCHCLLKNKAFDELTKSWEGFLFPFILSVIVPRFKFHNKNNHLKKSLLFRLQSFNMFEHYNFVETIDDKL